MPVRVDSTAGGADSSRSLGVGDIRPPRYEFRIKPNGEWKEGVANGGCAISVEQAERWEYRRCAPSPIFLLDAYRDALCIGRRFRYGAIGPDGAKRPSGLSVWRVNSVVERGIVVSHPLAGDPTMNGGHQHLVEWSTQLHQIELL